MAKTQTYRQMSIETTKGGDTLLLAGMHGSEALGRLFQFEVDVLSEGGEPIKAKDMLGTNVTIRLLAGKESTRYFNGFVSRFTMQGVDRTKSAGLIYSYRLTLVPWLWFLTRNASCRIFQDKTVPEIIKAVFKDRGFTDVEDTLSPDDYRKWEYCVQYRETDFNFVSRLMENEGIYYFFKHENGKHTLVLCDAPTNHSKATNYETLKFDEPDMSAKGDCYIWDWIHGNELLSAGYALTDFNPLTPKTDLYNTVSSQNIEDTGVFQLYDAPGAYTTPDEGKFYTKVRMGEVEAQYSVARATTCARAIVPGATFGLQGHPVVEDGDFLVTSATYQLQNDEMTAGGRKGGSTIIFQSQITAMPASIPFRPARVTPKPIVQGPQTAMVVGKSGEEIWTDKYGRVKVKFPWDPDPAADETSSCWVRVSQNWAGKKWGIFFLPRIGQEVIVDFLEGDPDRPIVTGRVYNAENMPPYDLPTNQTQSTIKSNTSKGGQNFNEIRFEDKKDNEDIFVHAAKNMDIRVKNDRFENILNNRHLVVEKDKFEHIKNCRNELIDKDHMEHIKGDYHQNIDGKEAKQVTGSKSLQVTDDVIEQFKNNHSEVVTNNYYLKADNIVIEGLTNVTIKVGNNYIAIEKDGIKIGCEESGATVETSSTGDTTIGSGANVNVKSQADTSIQATGNLNGQGMKVAISADSQLTLSGSGQAELSSSGQTAVKGSVVMIN
ncbi:MAG TPA: type VI secretion system tip protein TssI/VgrG [Phycisphaerae bacterium]|nr:type VI secretion system tip protein TssI/VgrG [Phycisphaerae bacterium]